MVPGREKSTREGKHAQHWSQPIVPAVSQRLQLDEAGHKVSRLDPSLGLDPGGVEALVYASTLFCAV